MKTKLKFLVCVLCCLTAITLPARADDAMRAKLLDFERRALRTAEIHDRLQTALRQARPINDRLMRQRAALPFAQEYAREPIPADAIGRDFFVYYGARLQAIAGEYAPARATFASLAGSPTVALDALTIFRELDSLPEYRHLLNRERNVLFREMLGKLLPASGYGTHYNVLQMKPNSLHYPHFPRFPTSKVGGATSLHKIALAFSHMRLYDRANLAWLEAIYGGIWAFSLEHESESWFSQQAVPLWSAAAQAQWQQGNAELLAGSLARIIVLGPKNRKETALQMLAQWRETGLPQQPELPAPDATQLMDIARMYVSLNMHTRAIELLHEFDDVIGPEAASLREQYLAGWLKLVRGLSRLTPPRTIYNQSIATPEDQAKVTVPPPLSAEALANAARIMEKIEAGHY